VERAHRGRIEFMIDGSSVVRHAAGAGPGRPALPTSPNHSPTHSPRSGSRHTGAAAPCVRSISRALVRVLAVSPAGYEKRDDASDQEDAKREAHTNVSVQLSCPRRALHGAEFSGGSVPT
jgi:hypothetical protein